jgi:hypothetical protein
MYQSYNSWYVWQKIEYYVNVWSYFNLWTVFHLKLFHGRWEKGEDDKKFDFYKIHILECELNL